MRITVFNAFRETLYREVFDISLDRSGEASIGLPLSTESLGQGIFLVKVEYAVPNMRAYRDYYRFSIMRPLENRHATKNMFGTLLDHCAQVSRGDEMAQKMMQWGWGSTTWTSFENMHDVDYVERMRKHRFTNMHTPMIEELVLKILPQPDKELNIYTAQDVLYSLDRVTPEMVRMTEEEAFRIVQQAPADLLPTTAFGNEEEGGTLPALNDGEDYFRLQQAVARGAKRARPDIGIAPTCGTAGYHVIHGFDAYERYLAVAQKHGFKYDAITIHVYGNIDRGVFSDHDLDEETSRLIDQMRRYGYDKETPILFTEGFNIASFGINPWAEDDRSGDFNTCGKPTYDFSRREFLHAASAARLYIISLKYWPQVQCLNIWQTQPFLDVDFSPLLLCKAVNTLGNEMGNVKFYSDVKLPDNIRGYLFTLEDETALALIWTSDRDVENGFKANPHIGVRFDQPVRFLDLMGCKRTAVPDENGMTTIPVTPAPLLIKAADVEKLSKALQNSAM